VRNGLVAGDMDFAGKRRRAAGLERGHDG
jgi:hypothetical protein